MSLGKPTRREFTRAGLLALGAAGSGLLPRVSSAISMELPDVAVAVNPDPYLAAQHAVRMIGGIDRFVQPGARVLLFPNIISPLGSGFAVNTHADVVRAVADLCVKAGATVQVYHHHDPGYAGAIGIQPAVEGVGASMVHMPPPTEAPDRYREVPVPMGRILDRIQVADLVLDTDVFIDIPVCKHHAGSETSMAIKNMMGIIADPRSFHSLGLHDCIADLATAIHPDLTVLDASTVLLGNGPAGPGPTRAVGEVVASTDPVAVDAYGTGLVDRDLRDVPYITQATKQRAGEGRLNLLRVERADV